MWQVTASQSCSSSPNPKSQFVCYHNHNMMEIMISNVVLSVFSATNTQAVIWSRNAFRDCFWDCYRRCACQLSANFSPRSCRCLWTTSKLEKKLNINNCSKWPLFFYRAIFERPAEMAGCQRGFIEFSVVPVQLSRKQCSSSQRQRDMFGN